MVTEEFKGTLSPVGNRALSVKVEGCLTASPIRRAGAKAGLSDPAVLDGKAVAQQIKGTPGITGLSPLSVHSGEEVWHLNISGCWTSNCLPTNRLITVNPYPGYELAFVYQPEAQARDNKYQNPKGNAVGRSHIDPNALTISN